MAPRFITTTICLLAVAATGCATVSTQGSHDGNATPAAAVTAGLGDAAGQVTAEALPADQPIGKTEYGISFQSLRISGAGLLLDFRYKVVDAKQAKQVINYNTHPYVQDVATGHQFHVPHAKKVGTLRHRGDKLQDGRSYSILFANPGRTIKSGDKVNLVIGQLRVEDVTVQ